MASRSKIPGVLHQVPLADFAKHPRSPEDAFGVDEELQAGRTVR